MTLFFEFVGLCVTVLLVTTLVAFAAVYIVEFVRDVRKYAAEKRWEARFRVLEAELEAIKERNGYR